MILRNQGQTPFSYQPGSKPIAQLVIHKIAIPAIQEVPELDLTQCTGGFGSTNNPTISFITHQKLNQTLDKEDQLFLCEITEEGVVQANIEDPRIQPLLQEFADVFPEELPTELPPP